MPNFSRTASSARLPSRVTSTPSIVIAPESGRSRRFRCFRSTVLPHPDGPTIVVIWPRGIPRSRCCSTSWRPKRRHRSRTSISLGRSPFDVVALVAIEASEKDRAYNIVEGKNEHAGEDHGFGRGAAHTGCHPLSVVALVAAHPHHDHSEHERLPKPDRDVVRVHVACNSAEVRALRSTHQPDPDKESTVDSN